MTRSCFGFFCILLGSACCATPTIAPAAGTSGPYVHLSNAAQSSRSGLAIPGSGWPPKDAAAAGACVDEKMRVESDLGVRSQACPQLQALPLPASGSIPSADDDIPASAGLDIRCYELGSAVLVVEYAQTAVECSHVIGLGVFHKAAEVR